MHALGGRPAWHLPKSDASCENAADQRTDCRSEGKAVADEGKRQAERDRSKGRDNEGGEKVED
jgi:hypothetical protein